MDLPQTYFDQIADPNVSVVNLPSGTFELPPKKGLFVTRPNLTINRGDCVIHIDNAARVFGEASPIQIKSMPRAEIFAVSPGGHVKRTMSHLTGKIGVTTNQLTMVPTEIDDVQPGETVMIWAGVASTDPYEPRTHFVMTVLNVDYQTGIITFTKPFGEIIPDYVNAEGLKAVVLSSTQWVKIGEWGASSEANFSKGFGADHGMQRFIGGLTQNIVFNGGLSLILDPPLKNVPYMGDLIWNIPNGGRIVTLQNAAGVTFNGFKIVNPYNAVFFTRPGFDLTVNDADVSGECLGLLYNTVSWAGCFLASWGGSGATINRAKIKCKNITLVGTEVGTSKHIFDDLGYDVEFTNAREFAPVSTIIGWGATKDVPRLKDAKIKAVVTSGPGIAYFSYNSLAFDGKVEFAGSSLAAGFDFGSQKFPKFDGTIVIGGVEYGPPMMPQPKLVTIPYAPNNGVTKFTLPKGLYIPQCRFRIKTPGNLRNVTDMRSGSYAAAHLNVNKWFPFYPGWHSMLAGDAGLAAYINNQTFNFWFATNPLKLDAVVEFNYTLLPQKV